MGGRAPTLAEQAAVRELAALVDGPRKLRWLWRDELEGMHAAARRMGHPLGQAMIATLRHRLIRIPARLVRHAGRLELRLPPGHHLLAEVLARLRALPATS